MTDLRTAPAPPAPRRSTLPREVAMRLAATEYERYLDLLRSLDPQDWPRPTECPGWDVRAMAGHNLGMAELGVSIRAMLRQSMAAEGRAKRTGEATIDAMTAMQVERHAGSSPSGLIARYAEVSSHAARGRRRRPALFRRTRMPGHEVIGGVAEPWTFGFVVDTILTRDCWMHRVDTARATGRELVLTAEHDGALVADVVAEWAARYRPACTLVLTGPAGGHWDLGDGPVIELDAVEFCRVLSRRAPDGPAHPLVDVEVPF